MKKLLVIDDDEKVREAVHVIFDRHFQVLDASDKEESLRIFNSHKPDVILLDIEFNGMPEGWEILKEIRKRDKQIPIYLMSGNGTYKEHVLVHRAEGFLEKPFSPQKLKDIFREKGLLKGGDS